MNNIIPYSRTACTPAVVCRDSYASCKARASGVIALWHQQQHIPSSLVCVILSMPAMYLISETHDIHMQAMVQGRAGGRSGLIRKHPRRMQHLLRSTILRAALCAAEPSGRYSQRSR